MTQSQTGSKLSASILMALTIVPKLPVPISAPKGLEI
jgi:hypothetical protein